MKSTIYLDTYIIGNLWWPMGERAFKPCEINLTEKIKGFVDPKISLRELLLSVRDSEGGDFSMDIRFQSEGVLTLKRTYSKMFSQSHAVNYKSRSWKLSTFSSIADLLTDEELPEGAFE